MERCNHTTIFHMDSFRSSVLRWCFRLAEMLAERSRIENNSLFKALFTQYAAEQQSAHLTNSDTVDTREAAAGSFMLCISFCESRRSEAFHALSTVLVYCVCGVLFLLLSISIIAVRSCWVTLERIVKLIQKLILFANAKCRQRPAVLVENSIPIAAPMEEGCVQKLQPLLLPLTVGTSANFSTHFNFLLSTASGADLKHQKKQ
ncbi:hypothetical protein T4A_7305 [Trichinella pseudospiralis]|uniref:Uncharacterized protein n=1 Tax=Trichinella pseudospiralis TaxID=6337 RepID=A0A0V1EEU5_TRIPS|nr:hypothetical protein T4A_7305 [Trichinella pseudospiralis]